MKYLFVAQHKKTWPIDRMYQLLGVTRSGYYDYQRWNERKVDDHFKRGCWKLHATLPRQLSSATVAGE